MHKKYIKIFGEEIVEEQLGALPYPDFRDFVNEYNERKSKESILAKDADLLDQMLLLREYEWQGNKEAALWLKGKRGEGNVQLAKLRSKTAQRLRGNHYARRPVGMVE